MKKENICNLEVNIWDQIDSQLFVNDFHLTWMEDLRHLTPQSNNVVLKNMDPVQVAKEIICLENFLALRIVCPNAIISAR